MKTEGVRSKAGEENAGQRMAKFGTVCMTACCRTGGLCQAFLKVKSSKGAAGIDGQSIKDFAESRTEHRPLLTELREKSYQPQPVRRVEIPKPEEGRGCLAFPQSVTV